MKGAVGVSPVPDRVTTPQPRVIKELYRNMPEEKLQRKLLDYGLIKEVQSVFFKNINIFLEEKPPA